MRAFSASTNEGLSAVLDIKIRSWAMPLVAAVSHALLEAVRIGLCGPIPPREVSSLVRFPQHFIVMASAGQVLYERLVPATATDSEDQFMCDYSINLALTDELR